MTSILNGLIAAAAFVVLIGACGSDPPKDGNGVNDVLKACQIKQGWTRSGNDCSLCESAVVSPRCDCTTLVDVSAACLDQANTRAASCPADIDSTCVFKCDRADCPCIEACYASNPSCKAASAARDGCQAAACDSRCH